MKLLIASWVTLALATAAPGHALHAQGSRAQPRTAYGPGDLAKLRWLEGSWQGAADGETPLYQRFHFINDSTVDISYFRDPEFSDQDNSGRLYVSVGRVYHTFGPYRWVATHVSERGLFLVPQVLARSSFAWVPQSPDHWTFSIRSGVGGHEHVVTYDMQRVSRE